MKTFRRHSALLCTFTHDTIGKEVMQEKVRFPCSKV